jgi:predicted Holliday junction resolvase-like endonuclease
VKYSERIITITVLTVFILAVTTFLQSITIKKLKQDLKQHTHEPKGATQRQNGGIL